MRNQQYHPERDNTEAISTALIESEKHQNQLTAILNNNEDEHYFLNTEVTNLREGIHLRERSYDPSEEKHHRIETSNLARLAVEHILHVIGESKYMRGYYKKFLCNNRTYPIVGEEDPSKTTTEFDARFGYAFALVDLVIAYMPPQDNRPKPERRIVGLAQMAKHQLLCARERLIGKKEKEVPDNHPLLVRSYDTLESLRNALAERYHRLDGKRRE